MPYKIPTEEKIERLEKEIASLKKEHKTQKKTLKKEVRRLKAKIAYLNQTRSLSIGSGLTNMENIINENQRLSESVASLQKELKDAKSELWEITQSYGWRQSEENKWTLECFWSDFDTDKYGYTFFDPKTLLITINPFTGANHPEMDIDMKKVREILNEDNDYQEALERVKPYVEKAKGGWTDEYAIIKEEGKKLLKKYIYLFSGYKY